MKKFCFLPLLTVYFAFSMPVFSAEVSSNISGAQSVGAEILLSGFIVVPGDTPLFRVGTFCAAADFPGVVWVHVHENETTALAVARQVLAAAGRGCIHTLVHGGSRYAVLLSEGRRYLIDPNRMFTEAGREAMVPETDAAGIVARAETAKAAEGFYTRYMAGKRLIVAVHNNHPGGFSVRSYLPGASMVEDALQVHVEPGSIADDFLYVTQERAFDYFSRAGFNVVLQNNETVQDDGSLSVLAARSGQEYINVEAQYAHAAEQKAMLEAVAEYQTLYYGGSAKSN